jgi:hypothetical protein
VSTRSTLPWVRRILLITSCRFRSGLFFIGFVRYTSFYVPFWRSSPWRWEERCDPGQRSIHLNCALPPPLAEALRQREIKLGVYRTVIVRSILNDALLSGVVQR